eukprot:9479917-Pyramimonas_sp.AAC.1
MSSPHGWIKLQNRLSQAAEGTIAPLFEMGAGGKPSTLVFAVFAIDYAGRQAQSLAGRRAAYRVRQDTHHSLSE